MGKFDNVPVSWKLEKFSSVAELKHGHQFRNFDFTKEGIKVFKITQIKENGQIDLSSCDNIDEKRLVNFQNFVINKGDILMALTGATIGKTARYNQNEIVLQNYRVGNFFSKDENVLSKDFLFHYLGSHCFYNQVLAMQTQSAQQNIGKDDINNMIIILPTIREQEAIASILSSLNDKIELNLQMNKTLEAIAQAIFKEWFVDFRFPGFDGEFVDGLPRGWKKVTLAEAVFVNGGSTPSTTIPEYWNGLNYWATPKDLSDQKSPVLLSTERRITDRGVKQISSGVLPKGTLLLSSRAPIGYLAINQIPVSINQGFIAIQGKLVSNLFMLLWLRRNMDLVKGRANGSTFQEISKSNFKGIGISIPHSDLLSNFDQIVNAFFERIVTNEKENQTLIQIRDILLPKLMTGKIRVA